MEKSEAKYKVGQNVIFCEDLEGKEINGIIVSVEYDESVRNKFMYYYNIEGTDKLYRDVPQDDIIKEDDTL